MSMGVIKSDFAGKNVTFTKLLSKKYSSVISTLWARDTHYYALKWANFHQGLQGQSANTISWRFFRNLSNGIIQNVQSTLRLGLKKYIFDKDSMFEKSRMLLGRFWFFGRTSACIGLCDWTHVFLPHKVEITEYSSYYFWQKFREMNFIINKS